MSKPNYWYLIRSFLIIAIILIHAPSGGNAPVDSLHFRFWFTTRQMINYPVPIFFFMAGYFIDQALVVREHFLLNRRVLFITLPYLLWTMIYSAFNFAATGRFSFITLVRNLILGTGSDHLYYIVVLLQLTLLTPFLIQITQARPQAKWLLFAITPLYLLYLYWYDFSHGTLPPYYNLPFPAWFIFYYGGFLVKQRTCRTFSLKVILSLLVVAGFLSLAESTYLWQQNLDLAVATSPLKVTNFIYATLAIVLVMIRYESYNREPNKLLVEIGRNSLGIYYVHMLVNRALTVAFGALPFTLPYLVYFASFALASLVISLFLVKAGNRVAHWIERPHYAQYLGF